MTLPGTDAGIVADVEFTARRWAGGVNRAGNGFSDLAGERDTAWRGCIGAAQTNNGWRHRHRHFPRDAPPPGESAAG